MLALTLALVVWVSPIEQSYGPFARTPIGGPHALAVSRDAMLLAWSEIDPGTFQARIHLGLLDHGARLTSPIAVVPLTREHVHAVEPEVTSDGTSFRVTYFEGAQLLAVDVDAAGAGAVVGEPRAALAREAVPPATVTWRVVPIYKSCGPSWCLIRVGERYELVWSASPLHGVFDAGVERVSAIAIAAANQHVVFVWSTPTAVNWLLSSGESFATAGSVSIMAPPAVACNAKECVVAYGTTSGDVHAASFEIDQPFRVMHVVVNASERHEHSPQVHALPSGKFLVSYWSDVIYDYGDHRIAGRLVSFGSPKRRSVE